MKDLGEMSRSQLQSKLEKQRHPNYRFLIQQAKSRLPKNGKLLDFGCGKGDIVKIALEAGVDAFGVECFASGSGLNIRDELEKNKLLNSRVFDYDGKVMPFGEMQFDVVVSNQVFEHVPDLRGALAEISRVLKPGGVLICIFPYRGAFREGHSNTFFTHWLPRSRLRFWWLLGFRSMGIGRLKGKRGVRRWAEFFDAWLEKNTFYLWWSDVLECFRPNFSRVDGLEPEYIEFRLRDRRSKAAFLILRSTVGRPICTWFCRKFGSLVLIATR